MVNVALTIKFPADMSLELMSLLLEFKRIILAELLSIVFGETEIEDP